MSTNARAPRIWIDVEHGAGYDSPDDSIDAFQEIRGALAPMREAWLFHRATSPPLRGFYYPPAAHQFGVPRGTGPRMVLVDQVGDQMWLSGASCGPGQGETTDAAAAVLAQVGFQLPPPSTSNRQSRPASCDEMYFLDGHLTHFRLVGDPAPGNPPGRTFVRRGRLIARMEFDKGGVTAEDLRQLWSMAVESYGWLGRPTGLLLYDSRRRAEESGHDGCQLVATGESGRELWLQLPEPDEFDRITPGRQRHQFEGAITEYDSVVRSIFRQVGIDIDPPDDRPLRDKLLGRHRVPPVLHRWP